ncbi:MAG: LysR family transcriptional regulator [Lachnospiraceae bacterium]|nr:LysR family transcriptional regulator [Lachnospiraceae bacterium]MBQ2405525.1 LysR family transcriptional regulator [Lachnospiraceae bacterium]
MTLQQLKYITTVAEIGNITEAAEKLFISQPSLTNAIQVLENELNVNIFIRSNKGVTVTGEGEEVLSYARQILEQAALLHEKFGDVKQRNPRFSVSCQHYSFAVNAFVDLIKEYDYDKYDFTIRETQTHEIIEDVSYGKSEIGLLYLSKKNEEVISKMLKKNDLVFQELFIAKPHVFIASLHPLANKKMITFQDLENYPYLSFEQGEHNSFYFSEEILSSLDSTKNIKVRDRATLFNLLIGLNGYTVSSGVIDAELNGEHIIARPLDVDEEMHIGVILKKNMNLSIYGKFYMEALKKYIS